MNQHSNHRRENGKRGGRPRGERPLSDRMQIRLYADQRARLEALGVNVNQWIREAVDERLLDRHWEAAVAPAAPRTIYDYHIE